MLKGKQPGRTLLKDSPSDCSAGMCGALPSTCKVSISASHAGLSHSVSRLLTGLGKAGAPAVTALPSLLPQQPQPSSTPLSSASCVSSLLLPALPCSLWSSRPQTHQAFSSLSYQAAPAGSSRPRWALVRVWTKRNPYALLVREWLGAATVENNMEFCQKTKTRTTLGPSNSTPGNISRPPKH